MHKENPWSAKGGKAPTVTYTSKSTAYHKAKHDPDLPDVPPSLAPPRSSPSNQVIYCCFVRVHGPTGTFNDVLLDLPRIKQMGIDTLWLLPIHPIGKLARKGTAGSPYSITDYRALHQDLGPESSFQQLISKCHQASLKVMLDIVFNHTSQDALYVSQAPHFYARDPQGRLTQGNPNWSDIADLDFTQRDSGLWEELVEVLRYWVGNYDIDGFRCDVATLVPLKFWEFAKESIEKVKPGVIWLAETYSMKSVETRRNRGLMAVSVPEMHSVFEMTYDYDLYPIFRRVLKKELSVFHYLDFIRFQSVIYPQMACKLRFVENHDTPRLFKLAGSGDEAVAWIAFHFLLPGAFLVYAGLEAAEKKTPSLFEPCGIEWGSYGLQPTIANLVQVKKRISGVLYFLTHQPVISMVYYDGGTGDGLLGVFNVSGTKEDLFKVNVLPDGRYSSLSDPARKVTLKAGVMEIPLQYQLLSFHIKGLHFQSMESHYFPSQ